MLDFLDSVTTIFRKRHSGIELVEMTTEKKSVGRLISRPRMLLLHPEMSPEDQSRH